MNESHREPKKTETIEFRLSSETKAALHERASAERRTVSDVIRGLIDDYLRRPPSAFRAMKGARLMRIASIPAGLCVLALIGPAIISPARADDVVLAVSAAIERVEPGVTIFHPNDGELGRGSIVRAFDTEVEVEVGQTVVLCMPRGGASGEMRYANLNAPCTFDAASGYALLLRVETVHEGQAYVTMRPVREDAEIGDEPASAIPIAFGQSAGMLGSPLPYRTSDTAPDEEVFRLTVRASEAAPR